MPNKRPASEPNAPPPTETGNVGNVVEQLFSATRDYWTGLSRYCQDFFSAYLVSTQYFQQVEAKRILQSSPTDTLISYLALADQNAELMLRGIEGILDRLERYSELELKNFMTALYKSVWMLDTRDLETIAARQSQLMAQVAEVYPKAITEIEPEFGFHFERGIHPLVAETDRFLLYQVMPSAKGIVTRNDAKPICILPPYVLGANILAFLPGEQRSYAHCFANQGVPTYIRILKDIQVTEALQRMSAEDDARDTANFCKTIFDRHGKPVTLNGYCQGGYNALCNLLSGVLDGLVDAFITCVSPMDGTRSKELAHFLKRLPPRFNNLAYGTRTLPNGNQVANGSLMGWVYKLKSIENESPLAAFFGDLLRFAGQKTSDLTISKTAAALNYWLANERNDLPLSITRISFDSYNRPIASDGTLPVTLFGKKLNLQRIQEKEIPWLICYGQQDDLVEKETALAPTDFIPVEVSPFPKGHVAIATSWSHPSSDYALHTRFGNGQYRGPVRFHLDLDGKPD